MGVPLAILLTITIIISAGFTTNSAYADSSKTKVGCKDLGLALITWDELYRTADKDDLEDFEDVLDDEDINPNEYEDIIDENMQDLSDKFGTKCDEKVDDDIVEKFDEDVDFNRRD